MSIQGVTMGVDRYEIGRFESSLGSVAHSTEEVPLRYRCPRKVANFHKSVWLSHPTFTESSMGQHYILFVVSMKTTAVWLSCSKLGIKSMEKALKFQRFKVGNIKNILLKLVSVLKNVKNQH